MVGRINEEDTNADTFRSECDERQEGRKALAGCMEHDHVKTELNVNCVESLNSASSVYCTVCLFSRHIGVADGSLLFLGRFMNLTVETRFKACLTFCSNFCWG